MVAPRADWNYLGATIHSETRPRLSEQRSISYGWLQPVMCCAGHLTAADVVMVTVDENEAEGTEPIKSRTAVEKDAL